MRYRSSVPHPFRIVASSPSNAAQVAPDIACAVPLIIEERRCAILNVFDTRANFEAMDSEMPQRLNDALITQHLAKITPWVI